MCLSQKKLHHVRGLEKSWLHISFRLWSHSSRSGELFQWKVSVRAWKCVAWAYAFKSFMFTCGYRSFCIHLYSFHWCALSAKPGRALTNRGLWFSSDGWSRRWHSPKLMWWSLKDKPRWLSWHDGHPYSPEQQTERFPFFVPNSRDLHRFTKPFPAVGGGHVVVYSGKEAPPCIGSGVYVALEAQHGLPV